MLWVNECHLYWSPPNNDASKQLHYYFTGFGRVRPYTSAVTRCYDHHQLVDTVAVVEVHVRDVPAAAKPNPIVPATRIWPIKETLSPSSVCESGWTYVIMCLVSCSECGGKQGQGRRQTDRRTDTRSYVCATTSSGENGARGRGEKEAKRQQVKEND